MNDSTLIRSEPSWSHRLIIALLILLGCLIMLNTSSVVDTARDVYNAWQISSGSRFPLEGPYVGGVFHGGPVWFYVLSVPLILSPGWILMNLWVGLLTGMKYALAYACGSRLLDRKFGLIWACLLALPDWTSVNYLIFSHTSLVETTFLLSFYSLVRWQQGSDRWFLLLCLAIGLGIHAHPTVYAAGLLALPFVVKSLWRKELGWWRLLAGALIALLPLVPYVISQQLRQWPDLQTGQGYFESQPLWMNALGFVDVMRGALLDGPIMALRHIAGLQGAWFYLAFVSLLVIVAGGLAIALYQIIRHRDDRVGLYLMIATVVCIGAVAIIRNVTPFYQTFVIYPCFYGLVAWGWYRVVSLSDWLIRIMIAVSLISLCGFFIATLQLGREGYLQVPPTSLMDVRAHDVDQFADTIYYPGWGRQQLGSFICDENRPLTFHGFSSLILEQSYALEARMRCDTETVFMGGQSDGQHYLGISHHDAGKLGIQSTRSLGSMSLFPVNDVIAPVDPMPLPEGDVYPPRPYYPGEPIEETIGFQTTVGEWIAVTNLYYYWMPYSFTVQLNGKAIDPLFKSMVIAYYGCTDCLPGTTQNWSVTIAAPRPELVEVVTFTPAKRKP